MRGIIIGFLVGIVVGAAAGVAAYIYVVPRFFPPSVTAVLPTGGEMKMSPVVARGEFIHADPADPAHRGSGKVHASRELLVLEADFDVNPGPDYHVYLVPAKNVTPLTNVEKTMYVDLGPLKAFKGAQSYSIPAGVDFAQYATVVIWSQHFGTLISPAELKPG